MSDHKLKIWENQPDTKHFWAFYYFCKNKKGDVVWTRHNDDGTHNLYLITRS